MENRTSDLWLGLGIGSVIGALVYRFSRTSKAKKLKKKVCDAFHKISGQAEEMLDGKDCKVPEACMPQNLRETVKRICNVLRHMGIGSECQNLSPEFVIA